MEGSSDLKRRRDELEQEVDSPEAKRLLLDIFDDDAEAGDQDIASVMKSLEEEIAVYSPPQQSHPSVEQPDLGFLFEASDDELGLPPPPCSSEETGEAEPIAADVAGDAEGLGFGQIWGFDDDLSGYEGFQLRIRQDAEAEAEDGLLFDGGLFDYADVSLYAPPDFTDLSWRSETLPAV